jgi:hypothetical protein
LGRGQGEGEGTVLPPVAYAFIAGIGLAGTFIHRFNTPGEGWKLAAS